MHIQTYWGGGGGGGEGRRGHSIGLPYRSALCYTVHIYNFVRDFVRDFSKDFPVGGWGIFWKGTFQ